MERTSTIPNAFIWRRLHSLTGLFLVLYLIEHLLVNSQAALFIGDDGNGFVRAVNAIHDLPFLPVIEIFLLGVPIVIHAYWGILYMQTSQQNYYVKEESKPQLEYPRNRAYTWQRITSWILLFAILAHVIHMRFIEYPESAKLGNKSEYMVRLDKDAGLYTLADRLGFELYDRSRIEETKSKHEKAAVPKEGDSPESLIARQKYDQDGKWVQTLEKRPIKENQVIAVSKSFGMAELLMVRETFKMPIMLALYTIFVLSACFHAFNGLWTFMISWGVTLTERSQHLMLILAHFLMYAVAFLGLSAIWFTYWFNLKQ